MEDLEFKGYSEPCPKANIRSASWHFDFLKSPLARPPKTLLSVAAPNSTTGPEPAESPSTAESATTATETASEPSTAPTSIVSVPKIFVVQKVHVSPSMQVDPSIQIIWTQSIKSRLSAELRMNISKGTCLQEFMMAGRRSSKLKPTLIVTCGDLATKREVEKTFKSQHWLQEILKTNHIMFVALVAQTPLSGAPGPNSDNLMDMSDCYAVQILPPGALTACGWNVQVNTKECSQQSHCTLGGLLMVGGEIMGLTAGHPFSTVGYSASEHGHPDIARNSESAKTDESSTISSDPFIFNEHVDDDSDNESIASSISLLETSHDVSRLPDDPFYGQREPVLVCPLSTAWHSPQSLVLPTSMLSLDGAVNNLSHHHDWALLKNLPCNVASLPNLITNIDRDPQILIEETTSAITGGEVTIMVAGTGVLPGYLHPSPATMKVDKVTIDVHLITLERILPLGVSGAWVSLENKLCGYIVAIRQDNPWAYMVAIEPVLDDIKRMCEIDDVHLPTALEIQQTASSRLNNTSRMSVDVKTAVGAPASKMSSEIVEGNLPLELSGCPANEIEGRADPDEVESLNENSPPMHEETGSLTDGLAYRGISHASGAIDFEHWKSRESANHATYPSFFGHSRSPLFTHRDRWKPTRIWHYLERAILRIEYRRAKQGWRVGWRTYRFGPRMIQILDAQRFSRHILLYLRSRGCHRLLWYFIFMLHIVVVIMLDNLVNMTLSILYLICCFPFIIWVAHRNRDVTFDSGELEMQRLESIEMLGDLPSMYDDRRLLEDHSRLIETNTRHCRRDVLFG